MSEQGHTPEPCKPPWHSVECYTGELPGFCGESTDPPWQPILEITKRFALAHVRGDMAAADAEWLALHTALGDKDALLQLAGRLRRAMELLVSIQRKTGLIKQSGMGGVLADIDDMITAYAEDENALLKAVPS